MDPILWVALANAIVWLGLGLYTCSLAAKQKKLSRRIQMWETAGRTRKQA